MPDLFARERRRRGRLLFEIPVALVLALLIVYFSLRARVGDGGIATVADHQMAVFVDYLSGELSPVEQAGTQTFLPWFQDVMLLDRRPIEYVMAGNERLDANHVPRLVVRGRDGSSYAFENVEVQYALDPGRLTLALSDSGPGDAFKDGRVDMYARAILRDAFGALTPAEVVLPARKQAATEQAKLNLARALERHGIEVLELSVSGPSFSGKYEETIARRNVADQDTQKLALEREQLKARHPARQSRVTTEKELELDRERAKLLAKLGAAKRKLERTRHEADAYHDSRLLAADLARDEKLAQAASREETFRKEAEGFRAQTEALAAQGRLAVRAALVRRLSGIQFELAPYARERAAGAAYSGPKKGL